MHPLYVDSCVREIDLPKVEKPPPCKDTAAHTTFRRILPQCTFFLSVVDSLFLDSRKLIISFLGNLNLCPFALFKISRSSVLVASKLLSTLCIQKSCSLRKRCICWRTCLAQQKPVPVPGQVSSQRSQVSRIQDFALRKVSCQPIAGNPMSPTKESVQAIQATFTQDSALAVRHEYNPQILSRRS